jgi:hypothetical protein
MALCASLGALALVFVQPISAQPSDGGASAPKWHLSAAQTAALTDANIAALKVGLNLTSDQAKNWPPLEAAIRDLAKKRSARIAARTQAERTPETHFDRVKQRAATLAQIATELNAYADAAQPLFQSLDSSQKQLFIVLTTKWVRP